MPRTTNATRPATASVSTTGSGSGAPREGMRDFARALVTVYLELHATGMRYDIAAGAWRRPS